MGDFSEVSSFVNSRLFQQYCTSFFGFQNCALYDKNIDKLYTAWRKAVRRLWKLPYRAHSNLLPHVSQMLPLDVILEKRYMNFMSTGMNHSNGIVNFIFNYGVRHISRIDQNVRYICKKYDIKVSDLFSGKLFNTHIIGKYNESVSEEDKRVGAQVRELAMERDSFDKTVLSKQEVCDIIEFLVTS